MSTMLFRAVLLAASALLLAAPAAGAAPRSACQKLRGTDLAPAKSVKLVDRGGLLRSCSTPNGQVRLLESGIDGDETSEVHYVRQVAGAFALITNVFRDKYASAEQTTLVNLRTGAKRALAETQQDAGLPPRLPDTRVAKALVTTGGRAVATVSAPDERVRVVALGAIGAPRTLAEAPRGELPSESLTLVHGTAGWTQAGQPVSAPLP